MLQVDGKNILCMSKGRGAVAVLSCEGAWHTPSHMCKAKQWLLLLLPLSLPPSSHSIVLLLLGAKQAVLGNHCCVILGFFIEFKWLMFLCEKCSVKVQCQTLKMLHVPHWFDHSVHYTPVFDSTVTCRALPWSPSLLSCATWMLFWECIRFRLRKNISYVFLFDPKVRRHAANGREKG